MKISSSELQSILNEKKGPGKIVLAFPETRVFDSNADLCRKIVALYNNAKILSLNYFTSKNLEDRKIPHDCIYGESMEAEHSEVFWQAEQYAQNWFKEKDGDKDFTEYQGFPLGHCLELLTFNFFQAVFKCNADVEVYISRNAPDTLVYFDAGDSLDEQIEPGIDFDIFKRLWSFQCEKRGIRFLEVSGSVSPSKKKSLLRFSPPVSFLGRQVRLPSFIYAFLKNTYLTVKSFFSERGASLGKSNLFFVGATTVSYLGSNVMEAFRRSNKFNLFVWNGESKQPDVINLLPFLTAGFIQQKVKSFFLRLHFRKKALDDSKKLREATAYQGFSVFDFYPKYFENLYLHYFPEILFHANLIKKQLLRNKVNAVISHTDHGIFERVALLVGNSLSIPTVCFQHGIEALNPASILGCPSSASYALVWGNANREYRLSKNMSASHVKIIGCGFHKLSQEDPEKKPPKIDAPGLMVFVMNSGAQCKADERLTFLDNERIVRMCLEMIREFPQKKLVLKPRISDLQIGVFRKLISDYNASNVEIRTDSFLALLKECDLYFHLGSTAALEGLFFQKPGIQFRFVYDYKKPFVEKTGLQLVPFSDYGANLGIDSANAECLKQAVRSIYESQKVREDLRQGAARFMRDFASLGDVDPAQKFVSAVEEILRQ
jgi:hypothetical protein